MRGNSDRVDSYGLPFIAEAMEAVAVTITFAFLMLFFAAHRLRVSIFGRKTREVHRRSALGLRGPYAAPENAVAPAR